MTFCALTAGADMSPTGPDPAFPYAFYANAPTDAEESKLFEEATTWCHEQFGPPGKAWTMFHWIVRFKHARDAAAFKVRWY